MTFIGWNIAKGATYLLGQRALGWSIYLLNDDANRLIVGHQTLGPISRDILLLFPCHRGLSIKSDFSHSFNK